MKMTCFGCGTQWDGFGSYCNQCRLIETTKPTNEFNYSGPWITPGTVLFVIIGAIAVIFFPETGIGIMFKFLWVIVMIIASIAFEFLMLFFRFLGWLFTG
jgi:hypothetical protein